MKKWRDSFAAKTVAWIMLTVSVFALVLSAISAYAIGELGYYTRSEKEIRDQYFNILSDRYSIWALNYLGSEEADSFFAERNFKYGIVKAEDAGELKNLDLNDDSSYVVRNFTDNVDLKDLHLFAANINNETSYTLDESLFRPCYIRNSTQTYTKKEIRQYVYDNGSGIFYYETDDGLYYPVDNVYVIIRETNGSSYMIDEMYEYDTEQKNYCKTEKTEDETWADKTYLAIYMEAQEPLTDESRKVVQKIFDKDTMTFNELDDTVFPSENWWARMIYPLTDNRTDEEVRAEELGSDDGRTDYSLVTTDGTYYDISDEDNVFSVFLTDIYENTSSIDLYQQTLDDEEKKKIKNNIYKNDAAGFLWVLPENETVGTDYIVVSFVQNPLEKKEGVSIWGNDLYVQADFLLNLAAGMKYGVYVILICSILLAAASTVFLFTAAGHRKGKEGITLSFFDKIPFDLFSIGIYVMEVVCVIAMTYVSYRVYNNLFFAVCWICGGIAAFLLAVFYLLNFVVRVKAGKWWKNTVLYRIFHIIKHGYDKVNENISVLWKGLLLFFGVNLLEVLLFILFGVDYQTIMFIWLLEKVVILVGGTIILIQMKELWDGGKVIANGDLTYKIDKEKMLPALKEHGENLNRINEGALKAVDEKMKSERFKTELITNVSHDIKTPLTSIINYVDLLQKEDIENEKILEYLKVLERQSARLKKLIEDLIEASKASTGNLSVNLEKLEAGVFLVQTVGEFEEKTKKSGLELVIRKPEEPIYIMADGRHFWRVIDNLMNNICKYAQPQTRVYINLEQTEDTVVITFRNTSKYPLNISSDELMERFVRGDSSRNTEGNGLGLSIATSLMELMKAKLSLYVDGDLFKVILEFEKTE